MVSACEVKIEVQDLRASNIFTNLDTIRGKVYVNVRSEISLSCIQIKLEGVSQSIIRKKEWVKKKEKTVTKVENHTLLYEAKTIFPPKNIRKVSSAKDFTLTPGEYEYDFEFKLPYNSTCETNIAPKNGITNKFQIVRTNLEYVNKADLHVQGMLPPSLTDLGDLAQINYFLKVTVKRASLIKPNIRKISPFRFVPFDSVDHINRSNRELNFLRREYVFKDKIPEIIALFNKPAGINSPVPKQSPPSPQRRSSIGKPPSYRLYVLSKANPKKYLGIDGESSGLGAIYLKSLKIDLFIISNIVSQEFKKQDMKLITLCQVSVSGKLDLAYARKSKAINEQTGSALHELEIPQSVFSNAIIPYSVVPSFKTCNVQRKYKLKITAGFTDTKSSKKNPRG
ncbi:unnamed protein product [Wickerhamomyces anomalus]